MHIDRQIRLCLDEGSLTVEPSDGIDPRIQPASLDVRLGHTFATFHGHTGGIIDLKEDSAGLLDYWTIEAGGSFVMQPGDFVLAHTLESIALDSTLVAHVDGKSSLGRIGLLVHSTAGLIDPGWPLASITLELANVNRLPLRLYPGMPIAQLTFDQVEPVTAGYSGKYIGQQSPAASKFHLNWTGARWI